MTAGEAAMTQHVLPSVQINNEEELEEGKRRIFLSFSFCLPT